MLDVRTIKEYRIRCDGCGAFTEWTRLPSRAEEMAEEDGFTEEEFFLIGVRRVCHHCSVCNSEVEEIIQPDGHKEVSEEKK